MRESLQHSKTKPHLGCVKAMLKELGKKKGADLVADRRQKFLKMGSKGLAA